MTTTVMPERLGVPRIPAVSRSLIDEETRTDLSTVIGLDVDLILGTGPSRVDALADMIDAGFVNLPDAFARLFVVAAELELDADELDEAEALGGWAA